MKILSTPSPKNVRLEKPRKLRSGRCCGHVSTRGRAKHCGHVAHCGHASHCGHLGHRGHAG